MSSHVDATNSGEGGLPESLPSRRRHHDHHEAPPTAPPSTRRVTRSQALSRVRHGESVHKDVCENTTPGNDASDCTPSDMRKDNSAVEAEVDTAHRSSDDTSTQVAGGRACTPAGDGTAGLDGQALKGAKRRLGSPDEKAAFVDGTQGKHRRRHAQREEVESGGAPAGEAESEMDELPNGKGEANDQEETRGLMGFVAPAPTTRARRAANLTRMATNAVPRLLALQRAFEKQAKHVYEYCGTHVVEWPTLAVEWIPDRAFVDPERDYTLQCVAIGTQVRQSSGVPNTVRVMEVAVPVGAASEAMYGLYGDDDIPGAEAMDPELQNCVDPGKRFANVKGHLHCEQTLTMDSPVLKIRAMPAETNIIAVKTASGFIGIYNLVQDLTVDEKGHTIPDALLRGHRSGGFGLSWNTVKPGYIASASDDGYVNYYDVSHRLTIDFEEASMMNQAGSGPETQPVERLVGHRDTVTDCCWHASQSHLLASSSMDGDIRIWDIRMSVGGIIIHSAHPSGATAAQFHPVGAFQLATAGAEGMIHLWDIRRTGESVGELSYHGRSITGLQWSPFSEKVMLSYGEDGRVVAWDLGKTSLPLDYSEDQVAPPEVAFVHIGHIGRVTDASWNASKSERWLMASADTANGLHFYRPSRKVVEDYQQHGPF